MTFAVSDASPHKLTLAMAFASLASFSTLAMSCASTSPGALAANTTPLGPAATVPYVYVAGYRPEILIFKLDRQNGTLTPVGQVEAGENPSYLTWDPDKRFLFALNEVDDGKVLSFAIDPKTAGLTRIAEASSAGNGPAHLSVDRSGRWVLVANYAGDENGTIGVIPIGADGKLGEAVSTHDFGPSTMPHMIRTTPDNAHVLVPCKGGPYVAQFGFDAKTGKLTPNGPDKVPAAKDAGPRHLDFHPNGLFAYVMNELNMTLTTYNLNVTAGTLTQTEIVGTLPAGAAPGDGFSTADVHVHPSGRFLYGSNRGHNTIVRYGIDAGTGRLSLLGHEGRTIDKPRNFNIDPEGGWLFVANQDGASVSVFKIDEKTGALDLVGQPVPAGENPSFVGVVDLPVQ